MLSTTIDATIIDLTRYSIKIKIDIMFRDSISFWISKKLCKVKVNNKFIVPNLWKRGEFNLSLPFEILNKELGVKK